MSCQQSHHRKVSRQDEYRDQLRVHELLWDGSHPHRSVQYRPSLRPLQGRKTAALLYQGSRPSLAGYAPLGLSKREMRLIPFRVCADVGTGRAGLNYWEHGFAAFRFRAIAGRICMTLKSRQS